MKLNKQNKILLFGSVLLFWGSYKLAISQTIEYYLKYKEQNKDIENIAAQDFEWKKLNQKNNQLDVFLKQYKKKESISFQNELLFMINQLCEDYDLKIVEFKEPHQFTENGLKISSYLFSIQGNYNHTLEVLNKLENSISIGVFKHIQFSKQKNYTTNQDFLITKVLLQKTENSN